jgi:flagellar P-ring protein FlgI
MSPHRICLGSLLLLVFCGSGAAAAAESAVRVKELAAVQGVRSNPLLGYGLVVGLAGTGDSRKATFTNQTLRSMLEKLGVAASDPRLQAQNAAAVMVTAELPPFSRPGMQLDVVVSSIGDASTLQGGTLLLTPLRAANGAVYAVAQGSLSIGGFSAGGDGNKVTKNHPTVGRIPGGAVVERSAAIDFQGRSSLVLLLNDPDFSTSSRMAEAINRAFAQAVAAAVDSGQVEVQVPEKYRGNLVGFAAVLESVTLEPDAVARVVLDERTGTVVVGSQVRIGSVAIAHGSLTVDIGTELEPSQPAPLSGGQTVVVPHTNVEVKEHPGSLFVVPAGATVAEIAKALNAVGATPREMIAIFQAMKAAGALHAELVVL